MAHIAEERRKTWHALIESTDMFKNSKKAWSMIGNLRGDPEAVPLQPKVTANQVAHQLLLNGKSGTQTYKVQQRPGLHKTIYYERAGSRHPYSEARQSNWSGQHLN